MSTTQLSQTRENLDDPIFRAACLSAVFDWMEANEVRVLAAPFNGEGDSGAFEGHVDFAQRAGSTLEWIAVSHALDAARVSATASGGMAALAMSDLVLQIAERAVESTDHGVDWWNGEGGRGQVEFILDGPADDGTHYRRGIHLTVVRRVVEYERNDFVVEGAVTPDDKDTDTTIAQEIAE